MLVGAILAVILGAANAYLGLYAGMTVSAVIPGAVMAFAILRPLKGTILEVNLGMMGAASGEALAAGVIFTIPALVLLGTWTEIHYVETTLIAMFGGILGVLWMVPLRRALIIKTDLPFPEGVAVAAVLTTTVGGEVARDKKGDSGVSGIWLVVGALVAAIFKFGQVGLKIFGGAIHGIADIGKFNIGGGTKEGFFYGGVAASPALLGVGWIIGPKIASFVFVGGLLGWVILAPLIALATGLPTPTTPSDITDALALGFGNANTGYRSGGSSPFGGIIFGILVSARWLSAVYIRFSGCGRTSPAGSVRRSRGSVAAAGL